MGTAPGGSDHHFGNQLLAILVIALIVSLGLILSVLALVFNSQERLMIGQPHDKSTFEAVEIRREQTRTRDSNRIPAQRDPPASE